MPNRLAHFAIEADDVERAKIFYESVFGWQFEAWGPPGFYLLHNAGLHGALQQRLEPLGHGRAGFHCSIAVDDLDATSELIEHAGGRVIGDRHTIPAVGELCEFVDTEGNEATIIVYAGEQRKALGL
ncbi:MAG: VOC family protein [Pseudomonadales bacterium]|jgi:predicted enzyme related to lactoylglutathione lyase|nr:VOC family protein [Pseudomonadales bacterium]